MPHKQVVLGEQFLLKGEALLLELVDLYKFLTMGALASYRPSDFLCPSHSVVRRSSSFWFCFKMPSSPLIYGKGRSNAFW